ncbi:MAG: ribonuclease P protein component [Caulobacterales bacterium]
MSLGGLQSRKEFLFVRQGVRAGRAQLVIEARRRAPDGPARFGLTATKKIGNAVVRNRARRRLRAAARALLPELGVPGVDYVLIARNGTAACPWTALLDDLRSALISVRDLIDGQGAGGARARGARPARQPPPKPS